MLAKLRLPLFGFSFFVISYHPVPEVRQSDQEDPPVVKPCLGTSQPYPSGATRKPPALIRQSEGQMARHMSRASEWSSGHPPVWPSVQSVCLPNSVHIPLVTYMRSLTHTTHAHTPQSKVESQPVVVSSLRPASQLRCSDGHCLLCWLAVPARSL